MTDEEKIQYVSTLPTGSLLYISGHTMVYIGMDENKNFVVSDLGTVVDEVGDLVPESVYAVTVNSLDVRCGASYGGTTWLHNLTGAIAFVDPIDISKCEVTLENSSYIYDGEEKKPIVNVLYNGKLLYQGVNFNVSYSNNIEEGTAIIEISGINSFGGKIIKNFEIKQQSEDNENQGGSENSGETPKTPEESSENGASTPVTDTGKKDNDVILDKFINTVKTGADHSLTWVIVAIIILTIIAITIVITIIKKIKGVCIMKNKKILVGIIVLIIAVCVVIGIMFFCIKNSTFVVKNNDDGSVTVTAENASENSGGIGYITLKEEQKLEVKTDLKNSSIKIEILSSNEDSIKDVIKEESFTKTDIRTFELPAGDYNIRITAEKDATGSMTINAK